MERLIMEKCAYCQLLHSENKCPNCSMEKKKEESINLCHGDISKQTAEYLMGDNNGLS